eukprot:12578197-Alexandrium_andersonii.AAC.1
MLPGLAITGMPSGRGTGGLHGLLRRSAHAEQPEDVPQQVVDRLHGAQTPAEAGRAHSMSSSSVIQGGAS